MSRLQPTHPADRPDRLASGWLDRPLTVASWVYGAGVRARLWWYATGRGRARSLDRPVVSVGNVTVGGTGKTPLVIALGEALIERGLNVGVLSRGYGGALERAGGLVSDGSGGSTRSWLEAGDEPALIAHRLPRATVIVGRDRATAWFRYARVGRRTVCLLDDGLQHLAVARDENLLLLDATESYRPAALLPRGRFREPLAAALRRATAVIMTRVDQAPPGSVEALDRLVNADRPGMPILHARLRLSSLIELGTGRVEGVDRLKGTSVLAVAGIARFESFRRMIEGAGASIVGVVPYRDHHPYRSADVEMIEARRRAAGAARVVTTEKDAVKLAVPPQYGARVWVARLAVDIAEAAEWHALIERIVRLAA